MVEENLRVALLAFRPFVLPEEAVQQEGKPVARTADDDL